ncbi:MAG: 50S ribosomal protein L29 [Nitrospirota bacterium]
MELDSVQQLRESPADDLRQKATAIRKELFTLRMHQVSGRVERPSQFRALRRQLARMLTVLNEQARQAATKKAKPAEREAKPARRAGAKRSPRRAAAGSAS